MNVTIERGASGPRAPAVRTSDDRHRRAASVALAALAAAARPLKAGEPGHYAAGPPNVRNLVAPNPGIYFSRYHYLHDANTLPDAWGEEVNTLRCRGPAGASTSVTVEPEVDVFALAPTFVWVNPYRFAGARVGALASPTFMDGSAQVSLSGARLGVCRD